MQFRIELDFDVNPLAKRMFAEYLYMQIMKDIHRKVNKFYKKYRVREKYILSSTLIKWKGNIPTHIDLPYYIENCLVLSYSHGTYIIKVNNKWLVRGSLTPVKLLVKMLEYGTEEITPVPVIRKVFKKYSDIYLNLFAEFVGKG